jgi:hypothetical protein
VHYEFKFEFEKSTPGTHVYNYTLESGRKIAHYIPKELIQGEPPESITITYDA